jgi:hypothetical protein
MIHRFSRDLKNRIRSLHRDSPALLSKRVVSTVFATRIAADSEPAELPKAVIQYLRVPHGLANLLRAEGIVHRRDLAQQRTSQLRAADRHLL